MIFRSPLQRELWYVTVIAKWSLGWITSFIKIDIHHVFDTISKQRLKHFVYVTDQVLLYI